MDEEVDLVNRDNNELNSHVKVSFEDVFGEPEGIRSFDCIWRNSHACFNCGKSCIYKLLTTICGLCIALAWGCSFGCIACQHVWCYAPLMRVLSITSGCIQRFLGTLFNCSLAPFCEACGMCFSKIHVDNSS